MRYTTIIDITEISAVWKSASCRMLYLYLCLKSGYHDDDRDMITVSVRKLAIATGLTKSATEHAIRTLMKAGLLSRNNDAWIVKKWTVTIAPTPRPRKTEVGRDQQLTNSIDDRERRQREFEAKFYDAMRQISRDELTTWIKELQEGRRINHYGFSLNPSQQNVNQLKQYLSRK